MTAGRLNERGVTMPGRVHECTSIASNSITASRAPSSALNEHSTLTDLHFKTFYIIHIFALWNAENERTFMNGQRLCVHFLFEPASAYVDYVISYVSVSRIRSTLLFCPVRKERGIVPYIKIMDDVWIYMGLHGLWYLQRCAVCGFVASRRTNLIVEWHYWSSHSDWLA